MHVSRHNLDLGEAAAQGRRQLTVDLHGNNARTRPHERGSQRARAGSEVDDEVVALNLRSANELRCKLATAEKMPAAAAM